MSEPMLIDAPKRFTSPIYGESGYERRKNDAYYTEHWVTNALCDVVKFRGGIWECAAGANDMAIVLRARGYEVYGTDIDPAAERIEKMDFLSATAAPSGFDTIATNPPYGRVGAEFARHALNLMKPVGGMVALLARHEWDSASERRDIFAQHPAYALKVTLTKRPLWDWWNPTPGKRAAPRHNFSWYVWDWQHSGPPRIAYAPIGTRIERGAQ